MNKFSNEIAHSLGVRLTADTRELIANCCSEFVQLLSSEANEICEKDNKKTISPDHILRALESLGLDAYVPDVKGEYEKYRKEDRVRGKGKATRDKKMEEVDLEEMARQQEILFAMARGDPMAAMGSAPATPVAKAKVDNDVARAPATPAANQEHGGAEKSPQ